MAFYGADTDISAIQDWYLIIPKFLNIVFCLIIKNIIYSVPYLFFRNFKNQDLWVKIFKIAAAMSIFCYDF